MSAEWFYRSGEAVVGPLTVGELREAVAYLIQSVASFAEHIQQKRQAAAASPPATVQAH